LFICFPLFGPVPLKKTGDTVDLGFSGRTIELVWFLKPCLGVGMEVRAGVVIGCLGGCQGDPFGCVVSGSAWKAERRLFGVAFGYYGGEAID
jgi:hypothetical protein